MVAPLLGLTTYANDPDNGYWFAVSFADGRLVLLNVNPDNVKLRLCEGDSNYERSVKKSCI